MDDLREPAAGRGSRRSRLGLTAAVLAAGVLLAPTVAAAGPWAPRPGHGYAKLWVKYFYGYHHLTGDGQSLDIDYHEVFLSAYAELGLIDRVGLVLHSPIVRSFHLLDPRDGEVRSYVRPGDPTLSVRWQFLTVERFVAGVDLGLTLPFSPGGSVQEVVSTGPEEEIVGGLTLGTGVWDVPASVGVGYAWDEVYLAGSVGYVLRSDGYDHVLTWSVEGGFTALSIFSARARIVGRHPLEVWIGERAPHHESPSGIGSGTSYIGWGVEFDFQVADGWYVGASADGGLGLIRRQGGGPVVTAYVARRF